MRSVPLYATASTCPLPATLDSLKNPVGQLVEVGERMEIKRRFCTGFNISGGGYFLTAGHCVTASSPHAVCPIDSGDSIVYTGSCVVNFGYELCDTGLVDTRVAALHFLEDGSYSSIRHVIDHGSCSPAGYDYGVLQLSPDSARHGSLKLSAEGLSTDADVVLFHHPEGHPKQYSLGKITSFNDAVCYYSPHTMGGSSGAPVISGVTQGVIGVHIRGDGTTQRYNNAARISCIVKDAASREQAWVRPYLRSFGLFSAVSASRREVVDMRDSARPTGPSAGCGC